MNDNMNIIRSAVGSMASWGLINELKQANVEVVGIDSNPLSFGLYKLKKSYVVPRADDSNFIKEILTIIDKEHSDAIISGPEEEILVLAKNKKEIEDKGTLVLCPNYESVEICSDKLKTHNLFDSIGIPTPSMFDLNSVEFPCLIKPRYGRGSEGVYIIRDSNELKFYINKIDEPIIQEYVQGEEYTIDVLADKNGNVLSVVPRLRLYMESGISVKSKTIYDENLINYAKIITKKLKLFGPSCIQCIKNKNGIKFLEVNTRFGGGSILSLKADPTIIPNLLKIINDENVDPTIGFKEGLTMLRYYSEVFVSENKIFGE